jgi:release factor glutamine methyltransferase
MFDVFFLILVKTPLDPLIASLASPFMERLKHSVDILLFNPTSFSEASAAQDLSDGVGIASAWAGGMDGMEVTNRFLPFVEVIFQYFSFYDFLWIVE